MTAEKALAVARAALEKIREEYRLYSVANDTATEALRAIANVDAEPVPTEALLRKAFEAGIDYATSRCIGGAPKFDEWLADFDLPEPVATAITDDPASFPPVDVPILVWSIAFNRWLWHMLEKPLLCRPADDYSHWRPAPPDPTRKESNNDQPTD